MATLLKFFQVKIFNTPALTDAVVTGQKAVITSLQDIEIDKVVSFVATAYAAGTAPVKDVDLAAVAVQNLAQYRMDIYLLDGLGTKRTYFYNSDATATTAEIKAGFIAQINADTGRHVNATSGAGDKIRLTAIAVTYDINIIDPSGIVITVITPHVAPAGTFAIAEEFDSVNAAAAANYKTFEIVERRRERSGAVGGAFVSNEKRTVIFVEETHGGFAALNARLLQMFSNSQMDAVLQDAAFATTVTSIAAHTTMTSLNSMVVVDASGGNINVTLEDSATLGQRLLVFINKTGANSIVFKKQGGDTLNGGAGDVTITAAKSALVFNDGAGAYYISELA
jgi:hypothetical protein